MTNSCIAIVVVTYNRLESLKRLVATLKVADYQNEYVDLIISVDKSETALVENYAETILWQYGKKIVDKHIVNLGLKAHILSLGKWFENYEALVILEDDLMVSKAFYTYTRQCFNKYKCDENIAGISLYNFEVNYQNQKPFIPVHDGNDVYFMNCAMSWGQVWLKKQWREFEIWYQNNEDFTYSNVIPASLFLWGEKSWLKYHTRYCIENNKFFVYPYISYTTNFSELGVNHVALRNGNPTVYQVVTNEGESVNLRLPMFDKSQVKYNGFYENKILSEVLSISNKDLCTNLAGCNPNVQKKRYYLTTEVLNYKVLKTYGLMLRPIEMNVIKNISGKGIFLYDTSVVKYNKNRTDVDELLYAYRISNYISIVKMSGMRNIINSIMKSLKYRIRRKFK